VVARFPLVLHDHHRDLAAQADQGVHHLLDDGGRQTSNGSSSRINGRHHQRARDGPLYRSPPDRFSADVAGLRFGNSSNTSSSDTRPRGDLQVVNTVRFGNSRRPSNAQGNR
jgi:hypothetical protein